MKKRHGAEQIIRVLGEIDKDPSFSGFDAVNPSEIWGVTDHDGFHFGSIGQEIFKKSQEKAAQSLPPRPDGTNRGIDLGRSIPPMARLSPRPPAPAGML